MARKVLLVLVVFLMLLSVVLLTACETAGTPQPTATAKPAPPGTSEPTTLPLPSPTRAGSYPDVPVPTSTPYP